MESLARKMPTGGSLFSAYASFSASYTLLRQGFHQFVPVAAQRYMAGLVTQWFSRKPPSSPEKCILVIEEKDGLNCNEIFIACQIYLCNKMSDSAHHLKISRARHEETMNVKLAMGIQFSDTFEGINLKWRFHASASSTTRSSSTNDSYSLPKKERLQSHDNNTSHRCSYFELIFDKHHKKEVLKSYLPFVIEASKDILSQEKVLKIFDCNTLRYGYDSHKNLSVNLRHPFTFDKLAMDPNMKKMIIDDLDRFVRRKEFYRRVGKPWKRGYLLYGPPGTGKSSLIAAMSNHLKFDIHDLRLGGMSGDSSFRQLLLVIPSRSIIVVEDIDCTRGLSHRLTTPGSQYVQDDHDKPRKNQTLLSALLNFVDGLWSCCGDERIIVFTTNHKEKLDPALLRPGRMDMHIHMSYLTMAGFRILARNYLQVCTTTTNDDHPLFGEIESLLGAVNATPAEVAEELMKSEDSDVSLQGVVDLLKRKGAEAEEAASRQLVCGENERKTKRQKIDKGTVTENLSNLIVPYQQLPGSF